MKRYLLACCLAITVSPTIDAMHVARKATPSAKRVKRTVPTTRSYSSSPKSTQLTCKTEAYDYGARALRDCIAIPKYFSWVDVDFTIRQTLPPHEEICNDPCRINGLVHYVVERAAQYPAYEEKYASVIKQLSDYGWSSDPQCCKADIIHTAVRYNLPLMTLTLIETSYRLFPVLKDFKGRTPLHYAQTADTANLVYQRLLGHQINVQDNDGNTPMHLAPADVVNLLQTYGANLRHENNVPFAETLHETPIRKAVAESNVEKCKALFKWHDAVPTQEEYRLLHDYIKTQLAETDDNKNYINEHKRYLEILRLLEATKNKGWTL